MMHGSWVLDGAGYPTAPSSVIAELQQIDSRLGLRYHPSLAAFIVTMRWAANDTRYQYIQRGELPPESDFEVLCPVPTTVSHDELLGWLAGQLRRVAASREDVRTMVEAEEARLATANAATAAKAADDAKEVLLTSIGRKTIDVGTRRQRVA